MSCKAVCAVLAKHWPGISTASFTNRDGEWVMNVTLHIDEANDISYNEEFAADGTYSGVEDDKITEPYPFDAEKISIENRNISLSNVIRRLERGLIQAAELQRGEDLWDQGRQSRLIESLMLKIPLPLFYAAATKDDELLIVDGLQRISAIKAYVSKERFKLTSLEFLRELEGKKFSELPDRMRIRIEETELAFVIIAPDSPQAVQRNIFKRLNTGGLPLTDQEIRHALYHGPVTELLKALVGSEEFQSAIDHRVNDSRMAAQELVLRFLAFSVLGIDEYRRDEEMDAFLSDTMQTVNVLISPREYSRDRGFRPQRTILNSDIEGIRKKFIKSMNRATELFGNCAFRISTPRRLRNHNASRTPINKSLFELWAVILSDMDALIFEELKEKKELLYERLDDAFANNESPFRKYVGKNSTKVNSVKGRYEIIKEMVNGIRGVI
jgi:hypothetical protein